MSLQQRRRPGPAALSILCGVAVFLVRCDGAESADSDGDPAAVLPEGVVYEGRASDEALERVWDKREARVESETQGARLTQPIDGATVPPDAPVTFTWSAATASRARPSEIAPPSDGRGPRWPGLALGVAVAHAHLPPVTGWTHLVELAPADGATPVYVFTTESAWTPDGETWLQLREAAQPLSVRITSTYLNQNVVEEGPFTGLAPDRVTIGG